MKINFNDTAVFENLENQAIDGQLNYDSFPSEEYRYFSKLAKLGYMNRHKGWSVEICEEKKKEYKIQYTTEKENNNRFGKICEFHQQNIFKSNEAVRKMYKAVTVDEILSNALIAIEGLIGEGDFARRIKNKIEVLENGNYKRMD